MIVALLLIESKTAAHIAGFTVTLHEITHRYHARDVLPVLDQTMTLVTNCYLRRNEVIKSNTDAIMY